MLCHPEPPTIGTNLVEDGVLQVSGTALEQGRDGVNYPSQVNITGPGGLSVNLDVNPDGSFYGSFPVGPDSYGTMTATTTDSEGRTSDSTGFEVQPPNGDQSMDMIAPTSQSTSTDTPASFSDASYNSLTLAGSAPSGSSVQTTISSTNGLFSLASTDGLTFSAGSGANSSYMTFTGSVDATNAALQGATFMPDSGFTGNAEVGLNSIVKAEDGSTLTTLASTVPISVWHVDEAPVNTTPASQSVNAGSTLTFSEANGNQVSVADPDNGDLPLQVSLRTTQGTISLATTDGLSFTAGTGTSDATVTFRGSLDQINAALDGMTFTPNAGYSGNAVIHLTTNDLGNGGIGGAQTDADVISVAVVPPNQSPVNNVPGLQLVSETGTLVLSAANGNRVTIADADAKGQVEQVTLTATDGSLTLTNTSSLASIDGNGTSTIVMTGTVAQLNTALNGMKFHANAFFSGATSIQISTNDLGNSGFGGALVATSSIAVNVIPPPTVASVVVSSGSIVIPLSAQVNITSPTDAFTLTKLGTGGGAVTLNVASQLQDGHTVVTLTFSGAFVDSSGALLSGKYSLRILGIDVTETLFNQRLDGNADGLAGGNYLQQFTV